MKITQSFISDFVDGGGAKIVRQEDRTKLDEAYKFLNDYVENNLRPVEVVNKNPKLGEDYIDAVFFMDKNDNILIQFFREDPTIKYLKGYPKNALTFEMGFKSFICNPFDLHSVDFDEVVGVAMVFRPVGPHSRLSFDAHVKNNTEITI